MPSTSRAQQQAMAIAEHNPGELYGRNRGMLDMTHNQLHDFAATSTKGLPGHVKGYAMGGPVTPMQNRAIHASMPRPGAVMPRPMAPTRPVIPPPMPYAGRYPMAPPMMPHMASGGQVGPENYYAQGGDVDVSMAARPVLPNQPAMQQPQTVGYARGGMVPPQDWDERAEYGNGGDVLSSADRRALPSSDFAVPSKAPGPGSYPMPDRAHAANAKARASQFGSPAVKAAVAAKAKAKFGMSKGGSVGTDPQSEATNERQARIRKFEKDNGEKEI